MRRQSKAPEALLSTTEGIVLFCFVCAQRLQENHNLKACHQKGLFVFHFFFHNRLNPFAAATVAAVAFPTASNAVE